MSEQIKETKWATWMAFWTSVISARIWQSEIMYPKYWVSVCVCVLRRFRLHTILYTIHTAGSTRCQFNICFAKNHSSDFKCKHFACEQLSTFFSLILCRFAHFLCSRLLFLILWARKLSYTHSHSDALTPIHSELLIVYHFSTLLHNCTYYQEK